MSSSYINQIDAAIAAVQPSAGQNLTVTPNPTGGLLIATKNSLVVNGITTSGTTTLLNPNAATSIANANSPLLQFSGQVWQTTSSLPVTFTIQEKDGALHFSQTAGPSAVMPYMFDSNLLAGSITGTSATFRFQTGSAGASFPLSAAANAVSGLTTYTGVITPGGQFSPGQNIVIAGFTNPANNGTFVLSVCTLTTVVVYNPSGVSESHVATATAQGSYYNQSGYDAALAVGSTFNLNGTPYVLSGGGFEALPNVPSIALNLKGDSADAGFLRVINDGVTGNHGLEIGGIWDGTGVSPANLHLGFFQGTACANISTMPLILGSIKTAATSSQEQSSSSLEFVGNYWTGSASAQDTWTVQDFLYLGQTYALTAAADFGGGRAQYTVASLTNPLPPLNSTVRISGFTNISNNGTFTVFDNRSILIVNNPSAVSETHAGSATITVLPTPLSTLILGHSGATNTQILAASSGGTYPQYSFITDPSCGLKYIGASQLELVAGGQTFGFSSQGGFFVGSASLSFKSEASTISGTLDPVYVFSLSAAASAVGPDTTYTGTFSTPFPTGSLVSISGFVNSGNNVTFASVVSCNSTTLVVVNANGVAETHVAVAESNNPCVFMGGGGSTPSNFTATLGLPQVAYDPPTAGIFTSSQAGRIWFNTTNPNIRYWDGSATQTVTQTIGSGQTALGTTLIGSGAASSILSIAATGVLSTDNVATDFASDPSGVTGYAPSANGMLTIIKFCTPGFVNFYQYNNTASSITPGAININWRVMR